MRPFLERLRAAAEAARKAVAPRTPPRLIARSAIRWTAALALAYALRTGLAASVAVAYLGLTEGIAGAAQFACAVAVAARVLREGILRRSLRDPLELNTLVKSLLLARRVRRRWRRAMHRAGLEKATPDRGPQRPRRGRVRVTAHGVAVRVDMAPIGGQAPELSKTRTKISSVTRAIDASVTPRSPGRVILHLRHTDPLSSRVIPAAALPPPRMTSAGLFVAVGPNEDGGWFWRDLRLPMMLVGAMGSGKSSEQWVILYQLLRGQIPFRLRVYDPKQQEFSRLEQAAHQYSKDINGWPAFMGTALGALLGRQADLARQGIHEFTRFTYANPFDWMIVDELLFTTGNKDEVTVNAPGHRMKMDADRADMLYLSQARAAGFSRASATQMTQKAVLGAKTVELHPNRTALRVTTDEATRIILDDANEYPAHLIPIDKAYAGIGYGRQPEGRVVKYRAAYVEDRDEVVKGVAAMTARIRAARPHRARKLDVIEGGKSA